MPPWKLRDQTRFAPFYELMRQIIADKRDHIVITIIKKTYEQCIKDGVIKGTESIKQAA